VRTADISEVYLSRADRCVVCAMNRKHDHRQTDSSAAAAAAADAETTTTISLWRWPASNDPIDGFISAAATVLSTLRYDELGRYAPWTWTDAAAVCQVCLVVRVVSHWRDTRTGKNRRAERAEPDKSRSHVTNGHGPRWLQRGADSARGRTLADS